jgi:hypothetical protein
MKLTSPVQTVIGASVLILAPFLLSCADSTGPSLLPLYQLNTVNGSPLPYDLVSVLPADGTPAIVGRETLLADSIQILNGTDFRRAGSVSTPNLLNHTPEITPFALAGSYTLRADKLTLTWIAYPPTAPGPSPVSESFVREGATLRIKRAVGPQCIDGTPQCADRPLVDFVYVAR